MILVEKPCNTFNMCRYDPSILSLPTDHCVKRAQLPTLGSCTEEMTRVQHVQHPTLHGLSCAMPAPTGIGRDVEGLCFALRLFHAPLSISALPRHISTGLLGPRWKVSRTCTPARRCGCVEFCPRRCRPMLLGERLHRRWQVCFDVLAFWDIVLAMSYENLRRLWPR